MKNTFGILLCLLTITNINAQSSNQNNQLTYKLDSVVVFINNSPRNWYTLNFETDTIVHVDYNMLFFNGKPLQIISIQFDNGKPFGVKGSKASEEYVLKSHKKWELDHHRKILGKRRLRNDELLFQNENGKPFLAWWFELPKNEKIPTKEIVINTSESLIDDDLPELVLNASHQLFLGFVVHGNTHVSLSLPVLENEQLEEEIKKLKRLANTLNVFGSEIDLEVLLWRLKNQRPYVFRDSLNLVSISLPEWFNVVKSPFGKNYIAGTCPEKDNIYNSIGLAISYCSENFERSNFFDREKELKNPRRDFIKILTDEDYEWRYFYTSNEGYFHSENVYIKTDELYFFVNFTATETTYEFNKNRFEEFLKLLRNE